MALPFDALANYTTRQQNEPSENETWFMLFTRYGTFIFTLQFHIILFEEIHFGCYDSLEFINNIHLMQLHFRFQKRYASLFHLPSKIVREKAVLNYFKPFSFSVRFD